MEKSGKRVCIVSTDPASNLDDVSNDVGCGTDTSTEYSRIVCSELSPRGSGKSISGKGDYPLSLTTTDPAAHLDLALGDAYLGDLLTVSRIDPKVVTPAL
jgi:hypothetical protein